MEFISCPRHPEFKVSHLYLQKDTIEILCENCLEENLIESETFQIKKLIHIKSVLRQPEIILKKLDFEQNISVPLQTSIKMNTSFVNEQIKEIEKLILDIQQQLQNMLQQFKSCVKKLEDYRKQLLDGIIQGRNFDSFKQIISGLTVQTDDINPDAIEQIKARLQQFFEQLQKNNAKSIQEIFSNKIYQIQKNVENEIQSLVNIDQLKLKLETFQNKEFQLVTSIFPNITKQIQSNLLSNYQQFKIISLIKQKRKKEIKDLKLIYLGTRDGLTAQKFWSKINGKANLLMVLKSKSNNIFGGYSPCQWQMNLGNWVQDNSLTSFLFSQTHNEIYPLREDYKQNAIFCYQGYGPTFGVGNDINISTDFQLGYSNLGYSYQWDNYQDQNSTHLFGQQTPNIMECEIYEIIFT